MKLRIVLAAGALGAVALLGAAACGPLAADTAAAADTASVDMSPEASALSALGFAPDQVVPVADVSASATPDAPQPSAPAKPGASGKPDRDRRPLLHRLTVRRALAKNVEHGEVVVKTKTGDQTIDVQRGTVTAINSSTVTVKSADGFTETWTFGSPIHVIEHRTTVQPSNVTTGETVGVAGTKSGSTLTATLLVIPGN
jgi:hypothetical protein